MVHSIQKINFKANNVIISFNFDILKNIKYVTINKNSVIKKMQRIL